MLQFTNFDVGFANSAYLAGAVIGAIGFGWLTDRIGRKKVVSSSRWRFISRHRGDGTVLERRELCAVPVF